MEKCNSQSLGVAYMCPLISAFANQSLSAVVSFDSENIPSLSVEVMVSASYDVLLVYPICSNSAFPASEYYNPGADM